MPRGDGIVCHPVYFQYHNCNLQALFERQLEEVPADEARDRIDQLLRADWRRCDDTTVTYIAMMPEQPAGWELVLVERELQIRRPDKSLWPARRILLCDRTYMEGPDGPRKGAPLKCGRPTPTLYMGPPLAIVNAGTDEEQMAYRNFDLYGIPFATMIPPTPKEEIEIAIDRATEVLLQESNATARELFQKTVETKEWLSMPRPTLRSSIFERIVREARRRAGVPAKLGAPHKN